MEGMQEILQKALTEKKLFDSTVKNIRLWLESGFLPSWGVEAIGFLIKGGYWDELNDRFYKTLEFGTGGMRGRTMGQIITPQEKGAGTVDRPERANVGTNVLNDFNIIRATIGLYNYCVSFKNKSSLKLVIAHDVRFFSKEFCSLVAFVWNQLGGEAYVFSGPRSTPQLSYTVRHLKAIAGIVITASHNPPHDNGFKVYFQDGGQVVSPHAEGIVREVNEVDLKEIPKYLADKMEPAKQITSAMEAAYKGCLKETVLQAELIKEYSPKVVFTPLHGTGGIIVEPLMQECGVNFIKVPEQEVMDPKFSTVAFPNPEYPETLAMALKKANEVEADLVLGTDPDGDRMGAAARNREGKLELLTGNAIGSLLMDFRIKQLKELKWIPEKGTQAAAVVKTFVTTPLQDSIGREHGLKVINTLTGFKYIGEKLYDYEAVLLKRIAQANFDYDSLSYKARAELMLKHSTFYIFGGEESYGFLGSDFVRDKDANQVVILMCEFFAYLKKKKINVFDYLDELYVKHGYFKELLLNIYYEGAVGAIKIKSILESYRKNPPKAFGEVKVKKIQDFGSEKIVDADGKVIPAQDFFFVELDSGYHFAVRGSGTEPKIKFYFFAREGAPTKESLSEVKKEAERTLNELKQRVEKDAHERSLLQNPF